MIYVNITGFVLISELYASFKKCCYFFPSNFKFFAVKKDYKDIQ